MDINVIAKRTTDAELIKSIVFLPEIFDCISEDGIDDFESDVNRDCWISIKKDDLCIGIYHLHPHNSATLEIHAHILPEHRERYSIDSGKAILKWILDESPDMYQKIIAQVPKLYPNVKAFCEINGFVVEGVNRLSHRKNGTLHDQWLLGITRDEIERFLTWGL